jgi:hypothetical protein
MKTADRSPLKELPIKRVFCLQCPYSPDSRLLSHAAGAGRERVGCV